MKKLLLLTPLLLTACANKPTTYTFEVKEHYTAIMTSEVQETTHDIYLAYCVRGVNEAFIEVPQGDKRTELELYYTGYQIKYTIDNGGYGFSEGWALYEN